MCHVGRWLTFSSAGLPLLNILYKQNSWLTIRWQDLTRDGALSLQRQCVRDTCLTWCLKIGSVCFERCRQVDALKSCLYHTLLNTLLYINFMKGVWGVIVPPPSWVKDLQHLAVYNSRFPQCMVHPVGSLLESWSDHRQPLKRNECLSAIDAHFYQQVEMHILRNKI